MQMKKTAVLGLLAALTCTQVGCLFGASSKTTQSGNWVAVSTFNQIEVGRSTTSFVEHVLPEPDSRKKLDDGTEIWKWAYTEKTEDAGYVFLIFGGSNEKVLKKTAYVQFGKDGVVTKAWRE